jgi:hypothetical protein
VLLKARADFADATTRARAKARIKFVKEIKRLSVDGWRGWAWLAERMFPSEFARSEPRTRVIERPRKEPAPLTILYNSGDKTLAELLEFPIHSSMKQGHDSPEVAAEKQRRLLGQMAEAPESEKISNAPPPAVPPPKALTGRVSKIPISRNGK